MSNWKPGDPERRKNGDEVRRHEIAIEASDAAKLIADAAAVAIKTLSNAASSAQSLVALDIDYIKKDMKIIKELLENKYVTKESFNPVKIITYGMTAIALSGVVVAIISMVIIHK